MLLRCRRGAIVAFEVRFSTVLMAQARREADIGRLVGTALTAM